MIYNNLVKKCWDNIMIEKLKILDNEIDKKEEALILKEISKIDGIYNYLKKKLALDLKRYFMAQAEQQGEIKGRYNRTMELLVSLQNIPLDK